MAAHRYWRVRAPETFIAGNYFGITELQMRSAPAGADQTTGKTATASASLGGYPPSQAIDDNATTFWTTGATAPPSGGHWLAVDFGAAVEIVEIVLTVRPDGFREDPKILYLDASGDGVTWRQHSSIPDQPVWTAGETRTLTATILPGADDPQIQQAGTYAYAASEASSGEFDVSSQQAGALAWVSQPAQDIKANQAGLYAFSASETPSGLFHVFTHQVGAYAWVKGYPDRRDLRAWTFTQDGHDFYVLQLGEASTLIFDMLTRQWARWVSPEYSYWRGNDGTDWEGFNLCCDPRSGKIFEIDPEGRLDYETTPIRSQVTGQLTERFRNHVNCYMAELSVSEAQPPASIDASTVGTTLRTYDSNGLNVINHGEVPGEALGNNITVRWYGLGLMQAPGRVFEITDTGYARRVEGFNLEVGGQRSE